MKDRWELEQHDDWTWTATHTESVRVDYHFDSTEDLIDFLREVL